MAALLLQGCGPEYCGGPANCACSHVDCPDFQTSVADNGRTFRMAVGEWISLKLPDRHESGEKGTASSSDPKVIDLEGNTASYVSDELVRATFHALKAGSAKLTVGYAVCPAGSSEPCSYGVQVDVVKFPRTDLTVDNVYAEPDIHLKVGQTARFEAPSPSSQPWTVTIDNSNVLAWAVEPIYPKFMLEAAVTARSPGTAHVQPDPCSGSEPVCSNPWRLTVSVT